MSDDSKPQSSQAITLFLTYVSLPPSCPTSTAARWGRLPPAATMCFTRSAISALIVAAVAFPSMMIVSISVFLLKKEGFEHTQMECSKPYIKFCFTLYYILGMVGIPGILGMCAIIRPIFDPVTIFIILRVWSNCFTRRFTS